MELLKMLVVTVIAVIGLPLLIVGATLLGPVGWIATAVVVPLGALAAIILVARRVGGPDEDV